MTRDGRRALSRILRVPLRRHNRGLSHWQRSGLPAAFDALQCSWTLRLLTGLSGGPIDPYKPDHPPLMGLLFPSPQRVAAQLLDDSEAHRLGRCFRFEGAHKPRPICRPAATRPNEWLLLEAHHWASSCCKATSPGGTRLRCCLPLLCRGGARAAARGPAGPGGGAAVLL